jgi:BirA family transcriptional regulator, biotin operon repressor / biotin---[acetyl-CoA-carboxylase] ligase
MFPRGVRFRLEVVDECPSTNDALLERRGSPDFHGSALLARRQTSGHGRRGRSWSTLEGNLALSFGLAVPESVLPWLPFACGLALFDTLAPLLPGAADLRLKWPNDLYLDGMKVAGMLSQGRQVPGRGAEVVVGIGVNLARAAYVEPPAPEAYARAILAMLGNVFEEYRDFPGLRADWEAAARLGEGPLWIVGEAEPVRALELLPTGELLLDGGRRLASEEVSLRLAKP